MYSTIDFFETSTQQSNGKTKKRETPLRPPVGRNRQERMSKFHNKSDAPSVFPIRFPSPLLLLLLSLSFVSHLNRRPRSSSKIFLQQQHFASSDTTSRRPHFKLSSLLNSNYLHFKFKSRV